MAVIFLKNATFLSLATQIEFRSYLGIFSHFDLCKGQGPLIKLLFEGLQSGFDGGKVRELNTQYSRGYVIENSKDRRRKVG